MIAPILGSEERKSPRRPSLLNLVRVQEEAAQEDLRHPTSPGKKTSPKTPDEGSPGRAQSQSPSSKNSPKSGLKKLFRRSHEDLAKIHKDEIQRDPSFLKPFREFERELNEECDMILTYELHEPTNFEQRRDEAIKKYKQLLAASRPALLRHLHDENPDRDAADNEWDANLRLVSFQAKLNEGLANIRKGAKKDL